MLFATCIGAMAIRTVGTVALFLGCRYQMGLPMETIAILVCSWYVLLTTSEVLLMAAGASEINARPESTLG